MQKDITVLAISGDSAFSHRAFAEEYDLHIPLLADVRGEVAAEYGVAAEDELHLTRRAVFVIDHTEQIEYAWVADDPTTLPSTDEIRAAIENIGDDQTAQARYRVGHAHYVEGRRAFTSAMNTFEDREWMLASRDFAQAAEEFDEARDEFNTAVRFSDEADSTRYFERAERKAEALWRAANWLNDSASSFASGEGRRGDELKQDAEGPLETARDIHEPPDPDDFPPEEDPADGDESVLPSDDAKVDNTLDLDEGAVEAADSEPEEAVPSDGEQAEAARTGTAADDALVRGGSEDAESDAVGGKPEVAAADETEADEEPEADIDDEELEAITAELEEQNDDTEATMADSSETADKSDGADVATVDDAEDDDLELELTDPTEGEEDDEDDTLEDIGDGDHGVPDSL